MRDSRTIKLIVILFVVSAVIYFSYRTRRGGNITPVSTQIRESSNPQRVLTADASSNPIEEKGNGSGSGPTPTPTLKQQAKVKGLNSPVKFERDLETSLKMQELPEIWFEYTDDDGEIIKLEIGKKAKEYILSGWNHSLESCLKNASAIDYDTRLEIQGSYINNAAINGQALGELRIETPFEKRKISEDEAFAVVALVAGLAIERYQELEKMAAQTNSREIHQQNF